MTNVKGGYNDGRWRVAGRRKRVQQHRSDVLRVLYATHASGQTQGQASQPTQLGPVPGLSRWTLQGNEIRKRVNSIRSHPDVITRMRRDRR